MSCRRLLAVKGEGGECNNPSVEKCEGVVFCGAWIWHPAIKSHTRRGSLPPPRIIAVTHKWSESISAGKKWVESLKAVMEAAGAVREWCGGQRARRGCKDQERSDQSIGCCRFPPGLQRMCLSNCQTGAGKRKNGTRRLLCGGKKQVFEVRTYDENRCHMCSSKYVNFPVLFWISQWIITVSESSNTSAIVVTCGRDVCGNFVYQPKKVWV